MTQPMFSIPPQSGPVTNPADAEKTVLCVCTGNICRSPAAAALLQMALGDDVAVGSAGTRALAGAVISAPMAAQLGADGLVTDGFAARQLQAPMINGATLVLALTRQHRGDVVELVPRAVRYAFTLTEFARLVKGTDPSRLPQAGVAERLSALVSLAHTRRCAARTPQDDDVADPYRCPDSVYTDCYQLIRRTVTTIGSVLNPSA